MTKRALAGLLVVLLAAPSTVFAQATKAGVVTILEGNVTARRVALPNPVPLKFKDGVFFQDTVSTGDKSLVRILLGGKAVVTVRELSVLTITEVPGKSTIDLESGKFGLAVAREKMRPGEEILIRTPNAIAAVHGTVVVTEVNRQGAAVVTNFDVLRGSIVAQRLDPTTRQPLGTPLPVGTLESYSGTGTATPSVKPVLPEKVAQIIAGLAPSGPKGGGEAVEARVKAQAVLTAVFLLTELTSGTGGTQVAVGTAPTLTTGVLTPTQTNSTPINVFTGTDVEKAIAPIQAQIDQLIALNNFPPLTGNVTVAANTPFKTFSGTFTSTSTSALIQLTNAIVNQSGTDFIKVLDGASVTLAGPLANLTNSTVSSTGALLSIANGSLKSTTTLPFFALDASSIDVDGNLINVSGSGATLTLAGPLLKEVGGTLATGGPATNSLLVIHDSAVVKDTSSDPFISLTNATVTSIGSLLSLRRSGATPSTLDLASPFLVTSGGSLSFKSTVLLDQSGAPRLCCGLFGVGQGAVFKSTTTLPLISLDGTSLSTGQNVLVFFDTTSLFGEPTITAAATATLAGPLFKATGSTSVSALTDFLGIFRSSVTSTTLEPFLDLNGTTVTIGGLSPIDGSTTAGRLVQISANNTLPASLTLQGPLLNATNSTIFTTDDAFGVFNGATLSSTTTSPLISVTGGSVKTGLNGNFFIVFSGAGLPGSALTLAGPLLLATGATLSNSDPTIANSGQSFLFIGDGSRVSSTSTLPFMTFTNSTLDTAANVMSLRRSPSTSVPTTLTLAGPLFSATGSTFNHTSLTNKSSLSACCNLFFVSQGARFNSSTTSALIQLTSSTVVGNDSQSGGNLLGVEDTFSTVSASELVAPASVTLAGPLLNATNSTITELFDLLFVRRSSVTSTTTSPLISLSGGTVTLGGTNPFTLSNAFGKVAEVVSANSSGALGSPATLSLAGPLLGLTNGATLNLNSDIIGIFNGGTLTSTTTSPFISVDGSTVRQRPPSGFFQSVLEVNGFGGLSGTTPATATLSGPLLSVVNGGTFDFNGRLVLANTGGIIVANDPTGAFVSLSGGSHSIATLSGSRLFELLGRSTATTTEVQSGNTLTLGTDQPLRRSGSGAFLELSTGAILTTQQGLFLDTALLAASAPLLALTGSSSLTTTVDWLNLTQKAKLTSVGPIAKIDASTLTISSGHALKVQSGSFVGITGDLFSIANAGKLNISNGGAIFASGNSVVNISGALVNFSGTGGNQINLTNTLCTSCTVIGGLNVQLQNSALAGNVAIAGAIKNGGLGAINLSNAGTTAVIIVDGASTKVTISGN
jgi:hypothetical protein